MTTTWLEPQGSAVEPPEVSAYARTFWNGCRAGRLRYQTCSACSNVQHTPSGFCASCGSRELDWQDSAGVGTVVSWTVVHRPVSPAFRAPYCPIIVRLDEGWHLISNLVHCDVATAEVGLRVRVCFAEIGQGFVLPYFEPDTG